MKWKQATLPASGKGYILLQLPAKSFAVSGCNGLLEEEEPITFGMIFNSLKKQYKK